MISELVGDTPIAELPLRAQGRLLLKLEAFNPGGSMKDRMARSMIADAERSGRLLPRGTIIESTSGNTGTGLAMIAAERGYRFIAVVDHHASKDKLRIMRALGAELELVGGGDEEARVATAAREARAEELEATMPGAVWLRQADNAANADGYAGLAREIHAATAGEIDVLVGAVGTGGSLCGTGRALRQLCERRFETVGVEPFGSIIFGAPSAPYYQSGTGMPAGVEVGLNVDPSQIDAGVKVTDRAAFNTSRWLARRFGILVGGSSGGVLYEALRRVSDSERSPRTVVAIMSDGGEKYLDTVFDDAWMATRGLLDEGIEREVSSFVLPR